MTDLRLSSPAGMKEKREMFLQRAADADAKVETAETEEIARTWRLIAGSWRTLADQADQLD